ncbi:MAG: hypothetical protein KAT70_01785, partial [Thermoplasmata archaeon]|nr:hypothetical protein [Thermoplasmata archaeon]
MKTTTAFTTTKIDSLNVEPIRIASWTFASGPVIYLTDRVWDITDGSAKNVFNSQRYEPHVFSWGSIVPGNLD